MDLFVDIYQWLLLTAGLVFLWYWLTKPPGNFPPAPGRALPLIGHMHMMEKNPINNFNKWSKQCGDIFSVRIGSKYAVVLNTYEIIKDAFIIKGEKFSNRSSTGLFAKLLPHRLKGVIFSSGPIWKEQRVVSFTILKDLGMGKNVLAERICEEVAVYVEEIAKFKGQPVDLKTLTNSCVSNVISSIIFGKRFELNDPLLLRLLQIINDFVTTFSGVSVLNFMPALKNVPGDPFKANPLISNSNELQQHLRVIINETKDQRAKSSDSFISLYMDQIARKQKIGQSTALNEESLVQIIDDLFGAGSETTSTTILWSLLFALHHPDVQDKIHKEIVAEIGTERSPTINDKAKLKYLSAFLLETERVANVVPFVVHECGETASLNGYTIPKGCLVIANFVKVHADPSVWTDPMEFRPERFLDADGNVVTKPELVPFSIGRRACLGEALAKMELFLFSAALFQRFQFLPASPNQIPPLTSVFGITLSPMNFEIRCVDRLTETS